MEFDFIRSLVGRIPAHPGVLIGPGGDDAALLARPSGDVIATVDVLTDGVDFLLNEVEPHRIGRKALAVNLSDAAAMGARPIAALVAVCLPKSGGRTLGEQLYDGILPLAAEFDCPIVGGDVHTWDGPLVLSITVLGQASEAGVLRRSAAQAGDRILVTGEFGGSILGKQFDFTPRVREGLFLARDYGVRCAMDVSDGLAADLNHLATESNLGAVLDLSSIPIAADAFRLVERERERAAAGLSPLTPGGAASTPLEHALFDGEDFELIFSASPEVAERLLADQPFAARLTDVGEFVEDRGLWSRDEDGMILPLSPKGWVHSLE
ncbi:MAG TPA: thiamine-phosphate kinase [Pirellulales bacterium]